MMLSTFFGWLRSAARDAILGGARDAAAIMAARGDGDQDAAREAFAAALAAAVGSPRALAAGDEGEAPKGKGRKS